MTLHTHSSMMASTKENYFNHPTTYPQLLLSDIISYPSQFTIIIMNITHVMAATVSLGDCEVHDSGLALSFL